MNSPLISVVTPTWQRNDLLLNHCVPSVQAQTYRNVEHIVVSDGPDPALRERMPAGVRYAEMPQWDPLYRWGVRARLLGIEMASGDLIAYLDDDNAYRPNHLQLLIEALERRPAADFAYSRMLVNGANYEVGSQPPAYGQIDTSLILHKPELLVRETWRNSMPTIDWDIVDRWLKAGAEWAFVNEVTVDYRVG